jgi:DNA-binding MarR family transcriptional regulator
MNKAEYIHLIKRLNIVMNQAIDDILKEYGLARSQYQVLYYIFNTKNINQKQIIEKMKIEPATLSVLVDTLETKKYIKKNQIKEDKRSYELELTPKGKKLVTKIKHPGKIVEKVMFKNIDSGHKKLFKSLVISMTNNLEKK